MSSSWNKIIHRSNHNLKIAYIIWINTPGKTIIPRDMKPDWPKMSPTKPEGKGPTTGIATLLISSAISKTVSWVVTKLSPTLPLLKLKRSWIWNSHGMDCLWMRYPFLCMDDPCLRLALGFYPGRRTCAPLLVSMNLVALYVYYWSTLTFLMKSPSAAGAFLFRFGLTLGFAFTLKMSFLTTFKAFLRLKSSGR
jgi:hypothetical protein